MQRTAHTAIALSLLLASIVHGQTPPTRPDWLDDDVAHDTEIWGKDGGIGGAPPLLPSQLSPPIVPDSWLVIPKQEGVADWSLLGPHVFDPAHPAPNMNGAPDAAGRGQWKEASAKDLSNVAGAYTAVRVEHDEVRMARLEGARLLIVNGEPFLGDVERRGYGGVPVALRAGVNHIYVTAVTESFTLELRSWPSRFVIADWDAGFSNEYITYPVFNASLVPAETLCVHYGHAIALSASCKPELTDWRCGATPFIPPLGMHFGRSYFLGMGVDRCPMPSHSDPHVLPIAVFEKKEDLAARQLIHLADGSTNPARSHRMHSPGLSSDSLFERWGPNTILLYGQGREAERLVTLAHARFEQQALWYRTGVVWSVLSDRAFLRGLQPDVKHSSLATASKIGKIVLFGNQSSNPAWSTVVPDELQIEVTAGFLRIREETWTGDDIVGWFLCGKKGQQSHHAVAVVADTGMRGARAALMLLPLGETEPAVDFAFYRLDAEDPGHLVLLAKGSLAPEGKR